MMYTWRRNNNMDSKKIEVYFTKAQKEASSCATPDKALLVYFQYYSQALEEFCKKYSSLCDYAEDIATGVIFSDSEIADGVDLLQSVNILSNYIKHFKSGLLHQEQQNVSHCEPFDIDLKKFCIDGKTAYIKAGKILNAENIDTQKVNKIRSNINPSNIDMFEHTCFIVTLLNNSKVTE